MTRTISAQQFVEMIAAARNQRAFSLSDTIIVSPEDLVFSITPSPHQSLNFERVHFNGVLFSNIRSANFLFSSCKFSMIPLFTNLDSCTFSFQGRTESEMPFIFRRCNELTIQSTGTKDAPHEFCGLNDKVRPGISIEDSKDLSLSLFWIKPGFNLQLWNCVLKTNNLNNNEFNLLQLRSVLFGMEIRLKGSTFKNLELSNITAPWLDADFDAFDNLTFVDRGTATGPKTFYELSKLYAGMRRSRESISMYVRARSLEASFLEQRLTQQLSQPTTLKNRVRLLLRIASNRVAHIALNRFYKRFFSPLATLVTGIVVIGLFAVIYRGQEFASGTHSVSLNGLEALYFSAITFCTVGYGDFAPEGLMRLFSSIEGLCGIVVAALFSLSLAKRFGL